MHGLDPGRPHAFSVTLASFVDPATRRAVQGRREQARQLRTAVAELKGADSAAHHTSMAALSTTSAPSPSAATPLREAR